MSFLYILVDFKFSEFLWHLGYCICLNVFGTMLCSLSALSNIWCLIYHALQCNKCNLLFHTGV